MTPYRAVDVDELRRLLGAQCSPMATRKGYVIGPDILGRLCHVGSCSSMEEARRMAERLNKKPEQKP